MNYTASGRKKKAVKSKKKVINDGKCSFSSNDGSSTSGSAFRSHSTNSRFEGGGKDQSYLEERRAISSNYTIAPAYNKGAYQVVSKEDIGDIGR